MASKAPSISAVSKAFPNVKDIKFLAAGGFKAVYDCKIDGFRQAFKLAFIPPVSDPNNEEEVAQQKEVQGRVTRELALLGKFTRPEIVKLGRMAPRSVAVEGSPFVAYSEEFLDGENLRKVFKKGGAKPSEAEVKTLFASLLRAIDEMWSLKAVHRDIKPENIVKLNDPARPFVLLDLGGLSHFYGYILASAPLIPTSLRQERR